MSLPATQIVPESGSSSFVSRRRNVDFPEPDGPTRKTNSPLAISTDASRSATVVPLYDLVTFSSRIIWQKGRAPTVGFGDAAITGYPRDPPTCQIIARAHEVP